MNKSLVESLITKMKKGRNRRPLVWGAVILVFACLVAADLLKIYAVCRNYSVSIADVVSASAFAVGGVDNSGSYPGYLVTAGIHFHMLLLTVLIGAGFIALLQRYHQCQDLALELYQMNSMRPSGGIGSGLE